jgi:Domain of unknown function (DUF4266)
MDSRSGKEFDRLMGSRIRYALIAAFLLGSAILSGCTTVKPWQRDTLSMRGMQVDPEPLIDAADDHIYFSREASKGGRSFGGGGCGCN